MAEGHAVVWSESDGPRFVGRLSVEDAGLHLRGASTEGELWDGVLGPDDIVRVRLVRPGPDDVDGSRSVVVEQRDGSCLRIVALDGAGRLFEIANLAAELSGRARRLSAGVAVEVPIRRGCGGRAERSTLATSATTSPTHRPSTLPQTHNTTRSRALRPTSSQLAGPAAIAGRT